MGRLGLKNLWGFAAALAAVGLIAISACGAPSPTAEEQLASEPNADPRAGVVYVYAPVEGEEEVIVGGDASYTYEEWCDRYGGLVRVLNDNDPSMEIIPDHPACQPDATSSESTPSPSSTD